MPLAKEPLRADVAAGIGAGVVGLIFIVAMWVNIVFPAAAIVSGGGSVLKDPVFLNEHEWGFNQSKGGPEICAVAGLTVNITLTNTGINLHGFQIVYQGNFTRVDGTGLNATDLLAHGQSRHIVICITQPGSYYYICPVAGHRQKGMIAPFVVQSGC